MHVAVERALAGDPNFLRVVTAPLGENKAGSHQTPSSICGGFEYFLLDFSAICTRKWLIVFSGLRVR